MSKYSNIRHVKSKLRAIVSKIFVSETNSFIFKKVSNFDVEVEHPNFFLNLHQITFE